MRTTLKWMIMWTMRIHGMEKISFLVTVCQRPCGPMFDPSVHPPAPPAWIDRLADSVELQRLCSMGVLMKEEDYREPVHSKLTTRFVYDWRLKDYKGPNNDQPAVKKWLRRSRCVAREYAFLERREDTFAPASSTCQGRVFDGSTS